MNVLEGLLVFLHPGFHLLMWFLHLGGVYLWGSCSPTLLAVSGSSECGQSAHLPANQQTTAQTLETGAENCFSWPNTFQLICVKNKQTKKLIWFHVSTLIFTHARLWKHPDVELPPTAMCVSKHDQCPTHPHYSVLENLNACVVWKICEVS